MNNKEPPTQRNLHLTIKRDPSSLSHLTAIISVSLSSTIPFLIKINGRLLVEKMLGVFDKRGVFGEMCFRLWLDFCFDFSREHEFQGGVRTHFFGATPIYAIIPQNSTWVTSPYR